MRLKFFASAWILMCVAIAAAQSVPNRLTIGPGDMLSVEVFDVPELKQEVRVSESGNVELVLVGTLHLSQLTTQEAQQLIATRLKEQHFVIEPQVSLLVREYATQGVSVMGEVRKPGIYQVLGPRTLMQVISEAGGLTPIASPMITINHRDGVLQSVATRITSSASAAPSEDPILHPGDIVRVPSAGIAYLVGDVTRSGGYVMQNEGELSIAQLVALGGGLLPTAKGAKAKLVRKTDSGHTEIEVNVKNILRGKTADFALQPDDILFIPNSALRSAANRLQNITQMTAGAAIYTSLN